MLGGGWRQGEGSFKRLKVSYFPRVRTKSKAYRGGTDQREGDPGSSSLPPRDLRCHLLLMSAAGEGLRSGEAAQVPGSP